MPLSNALEKITTAAAAKAPNHLHFYANIIYHLNVNVNVNDKKKVRKKTNTLFRRTAIDDGEKQQQIAK